MGVEVELGQIILCILSKCMPVMVGHMQICPNSLFVLKGENILIEISQSQLKDYDTLKFNF